MKKLIFLSGITILLILGGVGVGLGWWVDGHAKIAEAAAADLPPEMPAFFREAGKQLGHLAGDPDRWKNPDAKFLRAAESPDHYIDLEDYAGKELPPDRYQAIALLQKLGQKPERAGMLPYAIMENYDRLSCAFYDYRADRVNPAIRAKCIVYAGILSHLTGDCVMPLHTTRSFDGRLDKEGKLQQKGIHAKIDAFPERFSLMPAEITRDLKAKKIDDVWEYVLKTVHDSHKLIDPCYEMDKLGSFDKPTKESRAFILERCRVGAQFTMDLWYTAWLRSATMPKHY